MVRCTGNVVNSILLCKLFEFSTGEGSSIVRGRSSRGRDLRGLCEVSSRLALGTPKDAMEQLLALAVTSDKLHIT